jgi:hypothetical protein
MLTAAVRDLHRSHPGKFVTDVRTPCPALWENNPHLTPLRDDDPDAGRIECQYPLIHKSNSGPWHFIHGYTQFLAEKLGVEIQPTDFKGDIHLAKKEEAWMSQVREITREEVPFWIVNAGGKFDFTAKWWEHARYQAVVEHFRGRVLFVQVGEKRHRHPALRGVLDLRGKTNLRQLVRLVHHAQGVLCPVTLLMHLAAAVPVPSRGGMPKNRPCVVIAGGREPAQWEAYPHHQYLHTIGALRSATATKRISPQASAPTSCICATPRSATCAMPRIPCPRTPRRMRRDATRKISCRAASTSFPRRK